MVLLAGYWEEEHGKEETRERERKREEEEGRCGFETFSKTSSGQAEAGGGDGVGQGQPHSCSLGLNEEDKATFAKNPPSLWGFLGILKIAHSFGKIWCIKLVQIIVEIFSGLFKMYLKVHIFLVLGF
jgi:hypothetical protein